MGVPRLFKWLKENFSDCITTVPEGGIDPKTEEIKKLEGVENLFIDSNPLIHLAAQRVFNYGPNARKNFEDDSTQEEKLQRVMELYWDLVMKYVRYVNPSGRVLLTIDGVAPVAKQNQQRQRRFLSSRHSLADEGEFTPSWISPGTQFMYDLCRFVEFKIVELYQRHQENYKTDMIGEFSKGVVDDDSLRYEFIFSDANVPGEGEHKVLNFIRERNLEEDKNYFYGPDGDLIVLGLASKCKDLHVIKETLDNACDWTIIHISEIYRKLTLLRDDGDRPEFDLERCVSDFVLLCNFVGNDFLPKLKMFMFLENGMELMLQKYNTNFGTSEEAYMTDESGEIIVEHFKDFMREVSEKEIEYIFSQSEQEVEDRFIDSLLIKNISNSGVFDFDSYRTQYYQKELNTSLEGKKLEILIKEMVMNYIDTFFWTFHYYTKGLSCWETNYRYYEAPFLVDIVKYIDEYDPLEADWSIIDTDEQVKDLSPFVQLLTILPPSMKYLVPKEYQTFYDPKSEYYLGDDFWDEDFEEDLEGKTADYMVTARLPFCDREKVKELYDSYREKNTKKFKRDEIKYSSIGEDIFSVSPYGTTNETYRYKSKFGVIENCCVEFTSFKN